MGDGCKRVPPLVLFSLTGPGGSSDLAGDVTGKASTGPGQVAIESFTYTYDKDGEVTTETDTQSGVATTTTYTYDTDGELTGVNSATYSYNADGDRNSTGNTTGSENELTSDGTYNYTYDANGNVAVRTQISNGDYWTYGYNNNNEMTSALEKTQAGAVEQTIVYKYDVFGNRVETDVANAVSQRFAYDMWDPAKADSTGTSASDIWATLSANNSLTTRQLQGDGIDQHLGFAATGQTAWYLTDHLGSTRAVVNNSGTVADSIAYDAYGNITSESVPTSRPLYSWTGREFDVHTKLLYNRARFFDPHTGRWMSQDPMGFDAGDSNLYRYASNGPTDTSDPSGLQDGRQALPAFKTEKEFLKAYPSGKVANDWSFVFSNKGINELKSTVNFSRVPADRINDLLYEGRAKKVEGKDGKEYIYVPDVLPGGTIQYIFVPGDLAVFEPIQNPKYDKNKNDAIFKNHGFPIPDFTRSDRTNILPLIMRPPSTGFDSLSDVFNQSKMKSLQKEGALFKDLLQNGEPPFRLGWTMSYKLLKAYSETLTPEIKNDPGDWIRSRLAQADAFITARIIEPNEIRDLHILDAQLTFALHLVPFGKAIDDAQKGDWFEASVSAAGDLATLFTLGGGIAVKAGTTGATVARSFLIAGTVLEGGVAATRYGQAVAAYVNGDVPKAAGFFGEATLRLLGVGLQSRMLANEIRAGRQAARSALVPGEEAVLSGTNCFVAGTPVLTPDGFKPIEDFQQGDMVLSRSEHDPSGPLAVQMVRDTFERAALVISVRVKGRTIRTTIEHPFFVNGKGWVPAKQLGVGDELLSHDGQVSQVEFLSGVEEMVKVYNLTVEDYHTYFVGCDEWGFSVWVHNANYVARTGLTDAYDCTMKAAMISFWMQRLDSQYPHFRRYKI